MQLVKTTLVNGHFFSRPVCAVPSTILSSRAAMRCFLAVQAARELLGREGHAWHIREEPRALIPLYVATTGGDVTLQIK